MLLFFTCLIASCVGSSGEDTGSCEGLGVNVKKVSSGRDSFCCYTITLSNSKAGDAPYSFSASVASGIVSSYNVAIGFNQSPPTVPPTTTSINWQSIGGIRTGSTNLVTICVKSNTSQWLTYEWKNKAGKVICKDSVRLECGETEMSCCQFALNLYNSIPNVFKKIKITPVIPASINSIYMEEGIDDDEWSIIGSGGSGYMLEYITGTIPASITDMIDADFVIQINPVYTNPILKVEWLDGNETVYKTEEITLICQSNDELNNEDYSYPWDQNTKTISGFEYDGKVFAGAEAEKCDLGESRKTTDEASCPLIHTIKCNNNKLTMDLELAPFTGAIKHVWYINDVLNASTSRNLSVDLPGTGNQSISIGWTIWGRNYNNTADSIYCQDASNIAYCVPTASFLETKRTVVCDGTILKGFDVEFTPANGCNVSDYTWTFGDGQTVTAVGSPSPITHRFENQGDYTVLLKLKDSYGCTYEYSITISLKLECNPDWHAYYQWCDTLLNKEQNYNVKVTFVNKSTSFCNTKYTWDFGDGTTSTSNNKEIEHIYSTKPGKSWTVKLTMKDDKICKDGKTAAYSFELRPVKVCLNVTACSDGLVKFEACSENDKYKWDLPGWSSLLQDPTAYCTPLNPILSPSIFSINVFLGLFGTSLQESWVNAFNYNSFILRFKNGASFSIGLTGSDEQEHITGTCSITKSVTVNKNCCDEFKMKGSDIRTLSNGKTYKMKKKFVVNYKERHGSPSIGSCIDFFVSFWPWFDEHTKLKAKTLLKVRKQLSKWGMSITYYKRTKADKIYAGVSGTFRINGSVCNCETQTSYTVPGNLRENKKKAKFVDKTVGVYKVHKDDEVKSVHRIIIGSDTWETYLVKNSGMCK